MTRAQVAAAAADCDGSEMLRPAARAVISIFQPSPICFSPPRTQSSGMKTSSPRSGPFWKNVICGMCRSPCETPGVDVGSNATVMPDASPRPRRLSGSTHLERETHHGRDRPQRDVALIEVEPDADDLAAVMHALGDDADVGHCRRIRAGVRRGQSRSTESPCRRQGAAANSRAARRCRNASAVRPARANSAPSR